MNKIIQIAVSVLGLSFFTGVMFYAMLLATGGV